MGQPPSFNNSNTQYQNPNQQFNPNQNQQFNPNQNQQFNPNMPPHPNQQFNPNMPNNQRNYMNIPNANNQQAINYQGQQGYGRNFYFGMFGPRLQNQN